MLEFKVSFLYNNSLISILHLWFHLIFLVRSQLLHQQLLHNHNILPLLADLSNKMPMQSLWNKHHYHYDNNYNNNYHHHNQERLTYIVILWKTNQFNIDLFLIKLKSSMPKKLFYYYLYRLELWAMKDPVQSFYNPTELLIVCSKESRTVVSSFWKSQKLWNKNELLVEQKCSEKYSFRYWKTLPSGTFVDV